jgi:hypothetical protein
MAAKAAGVKYRRQRRWRIENGGSIGKREQHGGVIGEMLAMANGIWRLSKYHCRLMKTGENNGGRKYGISSA